jgi:hypothetical protein
MLGIFLGVVDGRPAHKVDNLANCLESVGGAKSHNPLDLHGLLQGYFDLPPQMAQKNIAINCCWSHQQQLFLVSGPVETHDQSCVRPTTIYMYGNCASSSTGGEVTHSE